MLRLSRAKSIFGAMTVSPNARVAKIVQIMSIARSNIWLDGRCCFRTASQRRPIFQHDNVVTACGIFTKQPCSLARHTIGMLNRQHPDHLAGKGTVNDTLHLQIDEPWPRHDDAVTAAIADLARHLVNGERANFRIIAGLLGQSGRRCRKANHYGGGEAHVKDHEGRLHARKPTVTNLSTPPSVAFPWHIHRTPRSARAPSGR